MKSSQKQLNPNLKKPGAISKYGTAGYRLNTEDLNNVICRASLIAYIRSATFAGKYIGLYITASHNPIEYNGVKFVDFNGNMLDESWEIASDELVNCEDSEFNVIINKIFRQNSNYSGMSDAIGNVIIGRDTRETGVSLTKNITEVLTSYRCKVYDYGQVTCPEMHFLIRKCNERNEMVNKKIYLEHLMRQYSKLKKLTGRDLEMGIDTAYGMAGVKIAEIVSQYSCGDKNCDTKDCGNRCDSGCDNDDLVGACKCAWNVEVLNEEGGILNKDCGADFVKTKKEMPKIKKSTYELCATFDGDVDRLLFYTGTGKIYDGDAQCAFIADYIRDVTKKQGIECNIGVVLSYYSNMGATEYLKGFEVVLAQTGVKNFVKEAKKFDVGIYFEPNGHGSVIFSKKFIDSVNSKDCDDKNIAKILTEIFDPCVGDALANFLFFKATLKSADDLAKFKENPSRLMTVKIKDKHRIKVDQKNLVLEPDIQKDIDQQIMNYKGRGFVRPSGTEDLVRVYAEAPTETACDRLALNIAQIVYDNCDGVGAYPEISYTNKEK